MAWTTQAYCTLVDVKQALDPNMTAVDDTFLSTLILQAQSDIDREVGYAFQQDGTTQSPATRLYDGEGKPVLFTDDIISLSQVQEIYTPTSLSSNGIWQSGVTVTTDITSDVVIKPNNTIPAYMLQRRSAIPFQEGLQNYQVSGVFGQPILAGQTYTGVPNDIMRATTRLVTHYYKMRDTNYSDFLQEQGGVRQKYIKTMPADVLEIVQRYKRTLFLGRWS